MTASTSPLFPPPAYTARTPEDLLALVPVLLGFVPSDSVAMLTFGAGHPFHARVDLPPSRTDLPAMVDALLHPVLVHRARQAVFVVYSGDARLARDAARCLNGTFGRVGVRVLETLRTDGERWWPATRLDGPGVPYDLGSHPFSARAVLEGRVLLGSREELRASVCAQPDLVAGVVASLAGPAAEPADRAWVAAVVGDGPLSDLGLARLLRALLDPDLRDAAWSGLTRDTARDHVAFWVDVVRRAPDPLAAGPAALLGLAAWRAGHGALAWCALDRAAEADADHPLADLVARLLEEAVPPDAWEQLR